MKLLNRLKFIFKYSISTDFVVWDFKNQQAIRFLKYEDAEKFVKEQAEYAPRIFVAVRRSHD